MYHIVGKKKFTPAFLWIQVVIPLRCDIKSLSLVLYIKAI